VIADNDKLQMFPTIEDKAGIKRLIESEGNSFNAYPVISLSTRFEFIVDDVSRCDKKSRF
jgi:hypothetical protein